MLGKFLDELNKEATKKDVTESDVSGLNEHYTALFNKYIKLGQSEFDIIRHFGDPEKIISDYLLSGEIPPSDMDETLPAAFIPEFLIREDEIAAMDTDEISKKKEKTEYKHEVMSRKALIINDVFLITPGLLIAAFGVIALAVVSVFMTAGSVVQMFACWNLATTAEKWGGFALSVVVLIMSALFYVLIVWIVKLIVGYMRSYVKNHKECWEKNV